MHIHTFTRFCESRRCFSLISPLNILHTFFCLSALSLISPCSLPAAVCRLRASLLHSPGARPSVSLSPPFLPSACPPLLLPAVCSVAAVCLLLCSVVSPSVSPSPCLVPSCLLCAPLKLSGGLLLVLLSCVVLPVVTRQPSGARRCGSVGRCTAYMSPAVSVSPLAYVLPCVPLLVPWLVLPAAVCRLVAIIGGTPLYPGRRRCGAASAM